MSDPRIDNPMWLVRANPASPDLSSEEKRQLTDYVESHPNASIVSRPYVNLVNLGELAARIERALRHIASSDVSFDFTEETNADRNAIREASAKNWEANGQREWTKVAATARVLWLEQLLANAFCGSEAASAYQPSTPGKELNPCDVS